MYKIPPKVKERPRKFRKGSLKTSDLWICIAGHSAITWNDDSSSSRQSLQEWKSRTPSRMFLCLFNLLCPLMNCTILLRLSLSILTGIPAVSDTLRTDGSCQIWTKLGQGGQYITQRYLEMKNTLLGMRGGLLGDLKFLLRGKWTADLSHDWTWIKNLLGWPQGGTKTFPKSTQKFLDPALIWSSRAPQSFFGPVFSMFQRSFRT